MSVTLDESTSMTRDLSSWKLSGIYPTIRPGRRYDPARIGCFIGDPTDYKPAGTVKQVKPADTVM